ncbi:PucR family transcriptional regulator [Blautia obeum]|uniref:helix-turn-helix domain-containing protein n=1 Tax=Blautia TaxID=572511 RepID=UPI00156E5705|nr:MULTISPECIES: helix-turn-helix domain-containing protein [Blautia]NSK01391.1 PucR family transcriptional regulator [Blautia obeum]
MQTRRCTLQKKRARQHGKLLPIDQEERKSLKKTCGETFLHKNTVQYRLNQIYKKCGCNPREFRDAVRLYLALKM